MGTMVELRYFYRHKIKVHALFDGLALLPWWITKYCVCLCVRRQRCRKAVHMYECYNGIS